MKYMKVENGGVYNKVSYRFLDKAGKVLADKDKNICFVFVFNGCVPANSATCEFYHIRSEIPFEDEPIDRWIRDLNTLGFPCAVRRDSPEKLVFTVPMAEYKFKLHFLSTLMLLRVLTEQKVVLVADTYLTYMDDNPKADKFKALIEAHHLRGHYLPEGHMITYRDEQRVEDIKQLFANFDASGMSLHFSGRGSAGYSAVNYAWAGKYWLKPEPAPAPVPDEVEEIVVMEKEAEEMLIKLPAIRKARKKKLDPQPEAIPAF